MTRPARIQKIRSLAAWKVSASLCLFFYGATGLWVLLTTEWATLDSDMFGEEASGVLCLYVLAFLSWLWYRSIDWRLHKLRHGME